MDLIQWDEPCAKDHKFVQAKTCELNPGVLASDDIFKPEVSKIYVDDALMVAPDQKTMEITLAAMIKAIFTVMCRPDTRVRQWPLAIDK